MTALSIVVPTFNERGNVAELVSRIDAALPGVAWEVQFVDDDSADGTADVLRAMALADARLVAHEADRVCVETPVTELISGGAVGADRLGEAWARAHDIPVRKLLPDWDKHGRAAGVIRNSDIVKEADGVIAFWDGASRGTLDTITKARKANKLLKVVSF